MDMSYQIVELEEKTVVGLTARMRNDDPECGHWGAVAAAV